MILITIMNTILNYNYKKYYKHIHIFYSLTTTIDIITWDESKGMIDLLAYSKFYKYKYKIIIFIYKNISEQLEYKIKSIHK